MNKKNTTQIKNDIPVSQLDRFQELIGKLFQCCQERMAYQSERFQLPDAEFRCLLLFGEERYLTAKGIAQKMNVVKSRITKIIQGLEKKGFVQRIKDPEDSRITLLTLKSAGQKKLDEINTFRERINHEILLGISSEQRVNLLMNLEMLKTSMQSVKDLME